MRHILSAPNSQPEFPGHCLVDTAFRASNGKQHILKVKVETVTNFLESISASALVPQNSHAEFPHAAHLLSSFQKGIYNPGNLQHANLKSKFSLLRKAYFSDKYTWSVKNGKDSSASRLQINLATCIPEKARPKKGCRQSFQGQGSSCIIRIWIADDVSLKIRTLGWSQFTSRRWRGVVFRNRWR